MNGPSQTPVVFDADAIGHPWPITELPDGEWTVQAVLRSGENSGIGTGQAHATPLQLQQTFGGQSGDIVTIDQLEPGPLPDVDGLEWVSIESPMLTRALGRTIHHRAAVIPPRTSNPTPIETGRCCMHRRFPGGMSEAGMTKWMWGATPIAKACFLIHLEAESFSGHHVFADSPGNGPRGTALVEESIRTWNRCTRCAPRQRGSPVDRTLVRWMVLALAAVELARRLGPGPPPRPSRFPTSSRSTSMPGANAFTAPDGQRRPLARMGRSGRIWYDDFVGMEAVMGDGGQILSFD